jgi:hypothetical protein
MRRVFVTQKRATALFGIPLPLGHTDHGVCGVFMKTSSHLHARTGICFCVANPALPQI